MGEERTTITFYVHIYTVLPIQKFVFGQSRHESQDLEVLHNENPPPMIASFATTKTAHPFKMEHSSFERKHLHEQRSLLLAQHKD